jgi:hypothetical protein
MTRIADRHQADLFAAFGLQLGLQLAQINVGASRDFRDQPIGPVLPLRLLGRRRQRHHLARLATPLLDPPHPRLRNFEPHRDDPRAFIRIASREHLAAKLRCNRFHGNHLLEMFPNLASLPRGR